MTNAVVSMINEKKLVFIYKDGKLFNILQAGENDIGNIYVARVENILSNLNACFVKIDEGKEAYLNNIKKVNLLGETGLHIGAKVLVQLAKEEKASKPRCVTSEIEMIGEHTIITLNRSGVGISRKINDVNVRKKLEKIGRANLRDDVSIVFRTSAITASKEDIEKDIENTYKKLDDVISKASCIKAPYTIYKKMARYIDEMLKVDEVVTDLEDEYMELKLAGVNCRYYDDDISLNRLYTLEKTVEDLYNKRVYLKSGANIVIEQTEAMTVIDVNSAKAICGNKDKKSFYNINLEAAKEILRQLRLRNLSGIVLVDFINMKNEVDNEELINEMKSLSKDDLNQVNIYGFTKLGLLEMSRKRENSSIYEYLRV